jgi:hypothetical protein
MMRAMRTTINLPEDLHRIAKAIAHDEGLSLSEAVVTLLRRALGSSDGRVERVDVRGALPTIRIGRPITSEDVRAIDDDV